MCAYQTTPNKEAIRRLWDLPILERWTADTGHTLTYFGLPGPEIHDLIDWQHVLGACTGVEANGRGRQEQERAAHTITELMVNVFRHGLASRFTLLRANVEDVILRGVDDDGAMPRLSWRDHDDAVRFANDIVNIDFCGGLGYRTKDGTARRVDALKSLFARQKGHDFVFLLTCNVRDTLGEEIDDGYLRGLLARDRGTQWAESVAWYRRRDERAYKLKAVVPSFIRDVAETHLFASHCHPPVVYTGHERARMMHFVFELHSQAGTTRGFSRQDYDDLLALPLLQSVGGHLQMAPTQHPSFTRSRCAEQLQFLPEETRSRLLAEPQPEVAV